MSHQASLKQQQLLGKIQVLKQGGMSVDYSEAQFTELAGHYILGEPPEDGWLVDGWCPRGHRGMVTAPEGSCKTIFKCWFCVCIASGFPFFGCKVQQGSVLIVDEETPEASLAKHLDRFSQGLGYKNWRELPIETLSMTGFRFGRKTELDRLVRTLKKLQPIFTSLDSLIAMLPGGRERIVENDSHLGETIRDDLNKILDASSIGSILLAAHSKKPVSELGIEALQKSDMQSLVRGHGSIVGQGCDTGYVLKKLSESPDPTRFAIITKARRQAIPMSAKVVYVEMKEEAYGKGWARLEEVPPEAIPPSKFAKELFPLFLDGEVHKSQNIVREYAFFTRAESYASVEELLARKAILPDKKQSYRLNPKINSECDLTWASFRGVGHWDCSVLLPLLCPIIADCLQSPLAFCPEKAPCG